MIAGETISLEVQVLDDGLIRARRKDRRQMTDADWREVYRWAGIVPSNADEVSDVFQGAKVIANNKPLFCRHCDSELIPEYQRLWDAKAPVSELVAVLDSRHGEIVERTWPDGRREWACHFCGRAVSETMRLVSNLIVERREK